VCVCVSQGSRPPAQLHAGLDGHSRVLAADGQELNEEEQQEIHKMFSDIHGSGEQYSTIISNTVRGTAQGSGTISCTVSGTAPRSGTVCHSATLLGLAKATLDCLRAGRCHPRIAAIL